MAFGEALCTSSLERREFGGGGGGVGSCQRLLESKKEGITGVRESQSPALCCSGSMVGSRHVHASPTGQFNCSGYRMMIILNVF